MPACANSVYQAIIFHLGMRLSSHLLATRCAEELTLVEMVLNHWLRWPCGAEIHRAGLEHILGNTQDNLWKSVIYICEDVFNCPPHYVIPMYPEPDPQNDVTVLPQFACGSLAFKTHTFQTIINAKSFASRLQGLPSGMMVDKRVYRPSNQPRELEPQSDMNIACGCPEFANLSR